MVLKQMDWEIMETESKEHIQLLKISRKKKSGDQPLSILQKMATCRSDMGLLLASSFARKNLKWKSRYALLGLD